MSDQPSIIRQENQHSVTVAEGSGVATSKPSDPHAPQVRQNLVGQDTDAQGGPSDEQPQIPPPLSGTQDSAGVVFERTAPGLPENLLQVPEDVPAPLTPAQAETETAVDRFLRERRLAQAEGQGPDASGATVFQRAVQDRLEPVPAVPGAAAEQAQAGPVFERSLQDHREQIPVPPAGAGAPSDGPVIERSAHDHFEAVPVPPPRFEEASPAPVLERALHDHKVLVPPGRTAPREGSSRPAPEPVPLVEARQAIAETGQALQRRVEESIGPPEQEWVEMDFPARVVKLKIENDKVRVRLDQLEAMAGSSSRTNAPL